MSDCPWCQSSRPRKCRNCAKSKTLPIHFQDAEVIISGLHPQCAKELAATIHAQFRVPVSTRRHRPGYREE